MKAIILGIVVFTFYLNSAGQKFIHYTTENSPLPSNRIQSVFIDQNNNKWIGTDKGLVLFDNGFIFLFVFRVDVHYWGSDPDKIKKSPGFRNSKKFDKRAESKMGKQPFQPFFRLVQVDVSSEFGEPARIPVYRLIRVDFPRVHVEKKRFGFPPVDRFQKPEVKRIWK